MKFESRCKFLGKEVKQSKKGNSYIVVSLMQESAILTVMSDVDINCDFGKDICVELLYNPRFKDLRLIGARSE